MVLTENAEYFNSQAQKMSDLHNTLSGCRAIIKGFEDLSVLDCNGTTIDIRSIKRFVEQACDFIA